MEIVSVQHNKKGRDITILHFDDNSTLAIPESEYLRLGLYERQSLTREELLDIKETIEFVTAKSTAVRYLSLKLRCEREVRDKLEQEGYPENTIDKVIQELKGLGYLNDRLYVQKFVYDRSKLKPKSKRMLKLELLQKGLSEEEVDSVLDEWKMDEETIARGLIKKKFGKYDLEDEKIKRKVYLFLRHRGFGFELARSVLESMKNGSDE